MTHPCITLTFLPAPLLPALACRMPEGSMAAYCAKQIVVDMLQFNQPPRLNLCRSASMYGSAAAAPSPAGC